MLVANSGEPKSHRHKEAVAEAFCRYNPGRQLIQDEKLASKQVKHVSAHGEQTLLAFR